MKMTLSLLSLFILVLLMTRCAREEALMDAAVVEVPATAPEMIEEQSLADWIRTLSSDEFEGRAPSSPAEEKTVRYLEQEFRRLGLQPGNGDSYFQEVPLVDITVQGEPPLIFSGQSARNLEYGTDQVLWTKRVVEQVELKNSELVFAGYGIVAPEYDWNDYSGLDVSGKTVVILVNDPGYATEDEALFNGKTMTYYGRWTYKFEEAARQGAAAALIVHQTGPAGYGWDTVRNSWTGPQFDLVREDDNMSRVLVEGWITEEAATGLLKDSGHDLQQLSLQARQRGFQGVPLGISASVSFQNTLRRSTSRNVAARIQGSRKPDEHVIYMAHWDHLGKDESLEGDQIFNGALDNATGTAGLLALAGAFARLDSPPRRSLLFLAVTAEEQGLLGSAYYAAHPIVPAESTAAVINMDGLNILGPMKDITVIGYGNSELDRLVEQAATEQGRAVRSDPEPEKGFYYRSDHFSLAKVGIPALYTDAGIDHVEHGPEWTMEKRDEYTEKYYHQPGDEYDPSWDLSGAVEDLRLLFRVGYRLAHSSEFPNWKEGTEFKALRDQQMRQSRAESSVESSKPQE